MTMTLHHHHKGAALTHCAGCRRPIQDQYLLHVMDRSWHAGCVLCSDCKQPLSERCFTRDGKIYCREDFFKRFGEKCAVCSVGIPPNVLVRKARGKVFHLACFVCMVCRKQLTTGEELVVFDEAKFMCKEDYISSKIKSQEQQQQQQQQQTVMSTSPVPVKPEKSPHKDDPAESVPVSEVSEDVITEDNSQQLVEGVPTATGFNTEEELDLLESHVKDEPNNNNNNSNNNNNNNSSSNLPSPSSSDNGESILLDNGSTGIKLDKENDLDLLEPVAGEEVDLEDGAGSDKALGGSGGSAGSGGVTGGGTGKRRGPRTTIKAKQLETLKAAFAATPKPTRHIREQLAQETGLNMRVIQVWFQNRRSKERRMKQLSAMGARRGFFRNPRRMRALRAGGISADDIGPDGELLAGGAFSYFGENGAEFYGAYGPPPGYPPEFFHGQPPHPHFMGAQPTGGPPGDGMHGTLGPPPPDTQFFGGPPPGHPGHPDFGPGGAPPGGPGTPELQQRLAAMDAVAVLQQQAAQAAAAAAAHQGSSPGQPDSQMDSW